MTGLFARKALLANGWADNVKMTIERGRIADVQTDASAAPEDVPAGIVIPGFCNAHSHAFQRALAGHTEHRNPNSTDTFWTWRHLMYALAGQVDAAALTAIAQQAYTEMLSSGYTSVVEFHYLHSADGGSVSTAMLDALLAAATGCGIRMTYVPVLYERADFDVPEPTPDQRRFAVPVGQFLEHVRDAAGLVDAPHSVGIGAHSLRAVSRESLELIAAEAAGTGVPMHIHIAEQQREVDGCLTHYGARPVQWLLDNYEPDAGWTLVHATHMDAEEVVRLAQSGAVACVCPSTEANLGDGFFRLQEFLENDGRIAIGSDSHVSINPFEELRWLEYGQRLIAQKRNVAAIETENTGQSLFRRAIEGGAKSAGRDGGELDVGANADLVVLDDGSPMLVGHTTESLLDALVFSGFTLPIDRVMVAGEWRVTGGVHERAFETADAYVETLGKLDLSGGDAA